MLISTRGRYALRVIIDLVENDKGAYIPMKDVAKRQGISLKYLEQILPILTKNDIVEAVHGKGGGYRFKKDVDSCSVWEILKLTENGLAPVSCLEDGAKACEKVMECRTIDMWRGLDDVVKNYLQSVKIADITKNDYKDDYVI